MVFTLIKFSAKSPMKLLAIATAVILTLASLGDATTYRMVSISCCVTHRALCILWLSVSFKPLSLSRMASQKHFIVSFLKWPMAKYDVDREIMNIYENLQIVWSHFFTDMLLFVNIWSTLNIYWFIGIRIRCQRIQMNNYSFTFDYSEYSVVRYSMSDNEGNFKLFDAT